MKKIRLITASFGDDPNVLTIEAPLGYKDYIIDLAFYNNINTHSRAYSLHPRMKGKLPKMMEWHDNPDYDYYIWMDSKFSILEGFIENMLQYENDDNADLILFKHPERSSMREEMDFMSEKMREGSTYLNERYKGEIMEEQMDLYLSDENFVDDKLFYCGCFLYSKKLVENREYNVMTDWLLNCVMYCTQDQLWLPYLLKKHKVNYKVYTHDLLNNNFLRYM